MFIGFPHLLKQEGIVWLQAYTYNKATVTLRYNCPFVPSILCLVTIQVNACSS